MPADSAKLNIVFASAEVAPFSKTGGLGEVLMYAVLPKPGSPLDKKTPGYYK